MGFSRGSLSEEERGQVLSGCTRRAGVMGARPARPLDQCEAEKPEAQAQSHQFIVEELERVSSIIQMATRAYREGRDLEDQLQHISRRRDAVLAALRPWAAVLGVEPPDDLEEAVELLKLAEQSWLAQRAELERLQGLSHDGHGV
jgi:hypothetical protein